MTKTVNGIIREGKFTGCPPFAPYFWQQVKDGLADDRKGRTYIFDITSKDKQKFPDLERFEIIKISKDRDGFIFCEADMDE